MDTKSPISYEKCPVCESTNRVAEEVLKGLIEEGKAGKDVKAFIAQTQSLIMDKRKTILSAPIIFAFYDICVDCGTYYCVHIQFGTAVPDNRMPGGTRTDQKN